MLIIIWLLYRRAGAMDTHKDDILALYVAVFSLRPTDSDQSSDDHNQLLDLMDKFKANRLVQSG